MLFSKFKKCNDEGVQKAMMLACMSSDHKAFAGQYALHKGRLIIALQTNGINVNDSSMMHVLQILVNNIPAKYGDKFDIWTWEKFKNDVPENIQEVTGYVSIHYPEDNR